jgi:hypothetical protein
MSRRHSPVPETSVVADAPGIEGPVARPHWADANGIGDLPPGAIVQMAKKKKPGGSYYDRVHARKEERKAENELRRVAHLQDREPEHERRLKERAEKYGEPLLHSKPNPANTSATKAHLKTSFVDDRMQVRGPLKEGVEDRFFTPTNNPPPQPGAPPTRQISEAQAETYKQTMHDVVDTEKDHADTHYAMYHAQDPRMRIAQDVYKHVYALHHGTDVPEDFHFMRFPGPEDHNYDEGLNEFFHHDMEQHGMIDDNIQPTKSKIISTNLSAFGGLGHSGEETFHYFQTGKGQTPPPVANMIQGFLGKFGYDTSGVEDFYREAEPLNDTPEGSLLQMMIPKGDIDKVAYAAHPHGIPHDDQLLDDLHGIGTIKYAKDASGSLTREKMNDEVTRKLTDIRDVWQRKDELPSPESLPVTTGASPRGILKGGSGGGADRSEEDIAAAKQRQDALLLSQAKKLHERTRERFDQGAYHLSGMMDDYIHDPSNLQHPEAQQQKQRMDDNPEHFGGQGMRSHHEVLRMRNRSNFLQARLHMSKQHMLNPESGIQIKRHTTLPPDREEAYRQRIHDFVTGLRKVDE